MLEAESEPRAGRSAVHPSFDSITSVLRSLPLLAPIIDSLDTGALADIEAAFEWYGMAGGTVLFHQGDPAEDTFIVVTGRFGVFIESGIGTRLIAQIGPGELVGEMSLLTGEPRSATVVALRDSEVVRIPWASGQRLMTSSPQLMLYILRLLAGRLKSWHRGRLMHAAKTLAVIPLDRQPFGAAFGSGLHRAFSSIGLRIGLLDSRSAQLTSDEIAQVEEQHGLVLYLADRRETAWSSRCLRQADRVLFVADAQGAPDAETDRLVDDVRRRHRAADLLLLNPGEAAEAQGGTRWIGRFSPEQIFHARQGDERDLARIARLTTGRAIGLVLSGGGARGFAHIGAIRAFEAAGIPIDIVGGTSMGALVGAGVGVGLDWAEIGRRLRHGFVEDNPVNDYTVPLVSLVRGRKMSRMLREGCGELELENLWRTFFCVSTNLSTGKIVVHQQGLLWEALRASLSLPGIVPPFIHNNEVLVDGGIMNNFPADVMSTLARGPVVGVEVTAGTPFYARADDLDNKSLLWRMRNRSGVVPNLVRILVRSATVNSEAQTELSRAAVDVLIQPRLEGIDMLSFSSFDKAVELGYQATLESLERLETPLV
jgi:NTE family protein